MTTPIQPDPPKFVPRKSIPFLTDTLFRVAGGPFSIVRGRGQPPQVGGRDAIAVTSPQQEVKFWTTPDDHSLAHETGHVIDRRGLLPAEITAALLKGRDSSYRPNNYAYSDDDEYIAETFAQAMKVVRSPADQRDRDIQRAEKQFPGITLWYNWIQQRLNLETAAK